jgi:hypothetical protein
MRTLAPLLVLLLAPLGCVYRSGPLYPPPTSGTETAPAAAKKKEDPATKRATLARSLDLEERKIEKARLELRNQETANRDAVAKATTELELATAKLALFEEAESVERIEKAKLDLQEAKDSLEDAREELAQLEMMYGEEDLADKTREIVLRRGQRRLARAADRLELREREMRTLETGTIPQERAKLALERDEKARALEAAQRSAEASLLEKHLAVAQAENEATRLRDEIASLETTAKAR